MKWIYILCSVMALGLFTSCYDEKALTPTEDGEGMSRYEFPQGTNAWDKDIEKIFEDFKVYLIYKNFKHADFNRSWTGGGLGIELDGKDLTDEQAEQTTRFMKNHVFAYLNEKIISRVLPMYWYMAYDLHSLTIIPIPGSPIMIKSTMEDYFDGLDFWVICLEGEDPAESGMMPGGKKIDFPVTKRDFFIRRGGVLENILLASFEKGNIVIPADFETGFDYRTEIKNKDWDKEDENYYLTRGFLGLYGDINGGFSPLENIGQINNISNFRDYIKLCLYYSVEELDEKYPRSAYPLIREKRDFVANYFKTTYDVDFDAIVEGPEISE